MRWPRLWPDGIAARIAATMVLGLVSTMAISVLIFVVDRETPPQRVRVQELARRAADIVALVEATPPERRVDLLRSLDSAAFHVRWRQEPPPLERDRTGFFFDRIRSRLAEAISGPPRRIVIEAVPFHGRFGDRRGPPPHRADRPLPAEAIRVSVQLTDGSWLRFTGDDPIRDAWRLLRLLLWIGLVGLAVGLLSVWASRRISAPLARFARAAEHLGLDSAASPLEETGPRELRVATQAVNRMQARLRRFVDDRTRLLAAISHDLRTPLTRLRLRAEFVDDDDLQRKMLADLDEMAAMLKATLSFARDDAAQEARSAVDLADLLQSLVDDRTDAGHAATYIGPGRLAYTCRPLAMRRAFDNLIDNAIAYGGTARLTLTDAPTQLIAWIDDDGPGIPDAEHEQVFAPFYRLEQSRSRDTGGTGLGLSVARSIIRGHGGDIVLHNRVDGGLRVTVTLPR